MLSMSSAFLRRRLDMGAAGACAATRERRRFLVADLRRLVDPERLEMYRYIQECVNMSIVYTNTHIHNYTRAPTHRQTDRQTHTHTHTHTHNVYAHT